MRGPCYLDLVLADLWTFAFCIPFSVHRSPICGQGYHLGGTFLPGLLLAAVGGVYPHPRVERPQIQTSAVLPY